MLRYGVIRRGGALAGWQSDCLHRLDRSGIAQMICTATPDRAERLRDLELDFCLLFGDREDGVALSGVAKYGVWYFACSDVRRFESDTPGFWEIYYRHDVTAAMLLKIAPGDYAGIVLKEARLPVSRDCAENAEALHWALSRFPLNVCSDIHNGVARYFADAPVPRARQRYGTPSRSQMLSVKLRAAADRFIRNVGHELYREDWSVARLAAMPGDYIGLDARAQLEHVWPHAEGKYQADPWIVAHDGKRYVFCEEFDYAAYRGRLAVCELPWRGGPPQAAIEEPFHLSYPQVFRHGDDMFCVPESAQAGAVRLYRAVGFPNRWEYVRTLIANFNAIDSTLVRFNGKWWLFCTGGEGPHSGFNSHLYIWFADDLFGEWRQHAGNPVKIDVRSSRPAGPFFSHQNQLYRPAQDCSRSYGGAISLNRIDTLTETEFGETVAGVIRPPAGRYNEGIHTITWADGECIVDVKRHAFYPRGLLAIVKGAVKNAALKAGVPPSVVETMKKRYR